MTFIEMKAAKTFDYISRKTSVSNVSVDGSNRVSCVWVCVI